MTTEPAPTTSEPEKTTDVPTNRYADLELHAGYIIIENGPPVDAHEGRTLRFHGVPSPFDGQVSGHPRPAADADERADRGPTSR